MPANQALTLLLDYEFADLDFKKRSMVCLISISRNSALSVFALNQSVFACNWSGVECKEKNILCR